MDPRAATRFRTRFKEASKDIHTPKSKVIRKAKKNKKNNKKHHHPSPFFLLRRVSQNNHDPRDSQKNTPNNNTNTNNNNNNERNQKYKEGKNKIYSPSSTGEGEQAQPYRTSLSYANTPLLYFRPRPSSERSTHVSRPVGYLSFFLSLSLSLLCPAAPRVRERERERQLAVDST